MTEYTGPQGQENQPTAQTPANQTGAPKTGDGAGVPDPLKCNDLKDPEPPKPDDPSPCFKPNQTNACNCPPGSGGSSNCLDDLIDAQAKVIAAAERAKTFKTDLEALLGKAKAAEQEYTKDKYDALVKLWWERDDELVKLIKNLVCAVPCWRCVIDCYVCPLLNELFVAEKRLYGDGALPTKVANLYELQCWHARDKDAKDRRFQRIKTILTAWEKPAQTLEKILSDNKTAIVEAGKLLASDPGKVTYDVFLKILPMHLAIAPRPGAETNIKAVYRTFCEDCRTGTEDECCGIDVREASLRQRLIGRQPYLIEPNEYIKLVCCLATKRYRPAKDALAESIAEGARVDALIKRYKEQVEKGLATFEKDVKRAIPSALTCCAEKLGPCPPTPKQAPAAAAAANPETTNA